MQCQRLASTESNDAANRIIGRDTHGHTVTRNDFDPKAAHAATQLRQHLVPGIALHPIQATGVNGHYGSLHVDQVVFAQ